MGPGVTFARLTQDWLQVGWGVRLFIVDLCLKLFKLGRECRIATSWLSGIHLRAWV